MGKYISIGSMRTGVCMKSDGTSINTGRRCGVEVFRYVEDNETVVPQKSKYLFKFLLASVDSNEIRYQHNWAVKATLNNNVIHNTTAAFPKNALLNKNGYLVMQKGQFYEVFSVEKDLDNNGSSYNLTMFGNCNSTVPKNCSASLSFTTPASVVAPQISQLIVSYNDGNTIYSIICRCTGNSAPSTYRCTITRYNNNGVIVETASHDTAANPNNPWLLNMIPTGYQAYKTILDNAVPGNALHVSVTAINSAGSASRDYSATAILGSAACKHNGVFKNATPYVKRDGTWYPANAYAIGSDGEWCYTKQGVELN